MIVRDIWLLALQAPFILWAFILGPFENDDLVFFWSYIGLFGLYFLVAIANIWYPENRIIKYFNKEVKL